MPAPSSGTRSGSHASLIRARFGDQAVRDGSDGGAGGWGALGSGRDPAGFDAALEAPPRDDERLRLIGDLFDAFFTATRTVAAADGERFVLWTKA